MYMRLPDVGAVASRREGVAVWKSRCPSGEQLVLVARFTCCSSGRRERRPKLLHAPEDVGSKVVVVAGGPNIVPRRVCSFRSASVWKTDAACRGRGRGGWRARELKAG
jgi:hypothetical protein